MSIINNNIVVIGGDLRQVYLANELSINNNVFVLCNDSKRLNSSINNKNYSDSLLEKADLIITPIPLTKDDIYVYSPMSERKIKIDILINLLKANSLFVGCKIPKSIKDRLILKKIRYLDLYECENFAIANAIPTAEGAIFEALKNSNITLSNNNSLVLGYGRCGKILAEKLKGLGSIVSIESRRIEVIKYVESIEYKGIYYDDLNEHLQNYDFIFNTIPSLILNKERLSCVNKDCLIIDIASKPGGTDFDEAKKIGIKAILSLGLPGKIAPKTSANIILNCIEENFY